jgi:hypothetical protein
MLSITFCWTKDVNKDTIFLIIFALSIKVFYVFMHVFSHVYLLV